MAPLYLTWCLLVCQKGANVGESYYEKEHQKHIQELCRRVRNCTQDEIIAITQTICDIDPDIILLVLHNKLKGETNGN